jgi:hypothetical protein
MPHHCITSFQHFEVAYGLIFKVSKYPKTWKFFLDTSATQDDPLCCLEISERNASVTLMQNSKNSHKRPFISTFFALLKFVQTWVTSTRTISEWQVLYCRAVTSTHTTTPHIRRWFTWIKLELDSSGTAKLNNESCRSLLTLTAMKLRRTLHGSQTSTVRELRFRNVCRPRRVKQWMKSRFYGFEMKPTKVHMRK